MTQIPTGDMTFGLTPDHIFGFEIQFNDNDSGDRDYLLKWWSAKYNSWNTPSHLGTVQFADVHIEVGVDDLKEKTVVKTFNLAQNYPNPFNPVTMINYQLPLTSRVELSIYNLLGQKITTLVSEKQPAGTYQIEWNAKDLSSGIYLIRLEAGGFVQTRKIILQK